MHFLIEKKQQCHLLTDVTDVSVTIKKHVQNFSYQKSRDTIIYQDMRF